MKKYNYSEIAKIDERGILFFDATFIEFEECKSEWAKENNISVLETKCVALRFQTVKERYFVFFSKERVKVDFEFNGFLKRKKSREKFRKLQMILNHYGYTSYDMT